MIGFVDNAGSLVVEYKYNAWGSIIGCAGSLSETLGKLNPFRYRGYVYDEETWMYWLKSRYYYPELSRFISADVVVGKISSVNGHNLYAYCGNEPVSRVDFDGTAFTIAFSEDLAALGASKYTFAGACGAAIGGALTAAGAAFAINSVSTTAKRVREFVETAENVKQENISNYSVYYLYDKFDPQMLPRYIGITNNPKRRLAEHQRSGKPERWHYDMNVIASGLDKGAARTLEQACISGYGLAHLDNARREIAVKNVAGYKKYMAALAEIIEGVAEEELYELIGE